MRRSDREIADFNKIVDILHRANTVRLGLFGGEYPYVVPLSYGFEAKDGRIVLYIHGAKEGLKHELLAKNNRVCVETDIFYRYTKTARGITTEYESFIGFGAAETITGSEALKGMDLLLEHCGYAGFEYGKSDMEMVKMIKITLTDFTVKGNVV